MNTNADVAATQNILLPPDPERIMEGLRDTGYNFNTAIADIVDNSIAADTANLDWWRELLNLGKDSNTLTDAEKKIMEIERIQK